MIEVRLSQPAHRTSLDIYILDRDALTGSMSVLHFGKHNVTMVPLKEGDLYAEPSLSLSEGKGHEFLKSMAEAAASFGIKLDSDVKREGKLEAVQAHLEDMRKLVFKGVSNE